MRERLGRFLRFNLPTLLKLRRDLRKSERLRIVLNRYQQTETPLLQCDCILFSISLLYLAVSPSLNKQIDLALKMP